MGGNLSKNSAKETAKVFTNVINKSYLNCKSSVNSSNIISILNANNVVVKFDNVNFSTTVSNAQDCESTAGFMNDIATSIDNNIGQTADALKASFGLGETEATNVFNLVQNLANNINSEYQTNCNFQTNASNLITIANSSNIVVEGKNTNFTAATDTINKCISDSKSVTDSTTALKNELQQKAKSKTIGILALIVIIGGIIIVIIILAVLLIPLLFGTTALVTKKKDDKKDDSGTDLTALATSLLSS